MTHEATYLAGAKTSFLQSTDENGRPFFGGYVRGCGLWGWEYFLAEELVRTLGEGVACVRRKHRLPRVIDCSHEK